MISSLITAYILISIGAGVAEFTADYTPNAAALKRSLIQGGKAALAWPVALFMAIRG